MARINDTSSRLPIGMWRHMAASDARAGTAEKYVTPIHPD